MNIKPYITKLCQENAVWMARLSNIVYEKDDDGSPNVDAIMEQLQSYDDRISSVIPENKNSAQAIFVEHEEWMAMVFRGTDEFADWLDNLSIKTERTDFGDFHHGFYRSLEDVWDTIYSAYSKAVAKNKKPLFITGHSLGGAMATVVAAKFIYMDRPFTSLYTFGQPRAVTRETARLINSEAGGRYYRFQNNMDVVSRIPARISGYSHAGKNLYITNEGDIESDPGFWFKFVDTITDIKERLDVKEMLTDHSMADYLSAIEKFDAKKWDSIS